MKREMCRRERESNFDTDEGTAKIGYLIKWPY